MPELYATSSEVWFLEELTTADRQWLSFALPTEAVLNIFILSLGLLALIVIFGLFTGKSWAYKPAFVIPASTAIIFGLSIPLYASAPYALGFDKEFAFSLIFTPLYLIWMVVITFYFRKPSVRHYVLGSLSRPKLPFSPLYSGTQEGDVIEAIVSQGRPIKWRELQYLTGIEEKSLNFALYKLIDSKEVLKIGNKYDVSKKIHNEYKDSVAQLKTDITAWINQ